MLELLDLEKHNPENYAGKLVCFNNTDYVIGECVGSGEDRIVHKLANLRSGLCLHVIKIYRNKEAELKSKNEVATFLTAEILGFNTTPTMSSGNLVPEILTTQIGNKTVAIEQYIGPYEPDSTETHQLMDMAEELISKSDYSAAIKYYSQVLRLNEHHTVAINNLSCCLALMDDLHSAFKYQYDATLIEPNYSEYRKNLIEYAAGIGRLGTAELQFEILKNIFSYYSRIDELMVQVFREIGKPEKIKNLSIYDNADFEERKAVDSEIANKEKAGQIISDARDDFFKGDLATASDKLKAAYDVYDKCALHKVNLAFCAAREGDYDSAIKLLSTSVNLLHYDYGLLIYFNIGICYIRKQDFANAFKYLQAVAQLLLQDPDQDSPISLGDLPGTGMWIDEKGMLEEPIESTFLQIRHFFDQYSGSSQNELLRGLYDLYEQASQIREN